MFLAKEEENTRDNEHDMSCVMETRRPCKQVLSDITSADEGPGKDLHKVFCRARKSDGAILNGLLKGPGSVLHWFFESNDIFILDRGFRDSIPLLESHGYVGVMPESKTRGATQLTAIQANKSRMCTICRWPVEIVNGRLKRDFKILRQEYFNVAMRHMFTDVKIAFVQRCVSDGVSCSILSNSSIVRPVQ
ncbi:Uncharacterized protein OBRU01_24575 [Operophtera brumata]|uniref:DDE Tnp4 domain-containing protein n=1 Tax=Operophtera brumata TaxID=104452 RepID=A0A0L7KLW9_OPEBR|nr:Uncharacterized protein OBRU01_24575 [Operophtera brumata]